MSRFAQLSWPARLAVFAALLALGVIIFGAFVRLSNAGLSCPDWPTCYGKVTWPGHEHEIAQANANFDRPVETHKAWREQGHRMVAGLLGVLILSLALIAVRRHKRALVLVATAAVAAACGVVSYMKGAYPISVGFSIVALLLPILIAWRLDRAAPWRIAVLLLAVVTFQAMLGMWTVTWLLKPVVVMAHLVGGLTTFALMSYVALRLCGVGSNDASSMDVRRFVVIGIILLAAQIALGGWTSANYAALACGMDFPTCMGQWWPQTDFREGFILWRGIGADYEGGILDAPARAAIQLTHRIGAVVVFCYLGWLSHKLARRGLRKASIVLGVGLVIQVLLGIGNVKLGLPLHVAIAHVAVAVMLLFTLVYMLARTQPRLPITSR